MLANDSDPDNNTPLRVTAVSQPPAGQGTVVLNADGSLTYTPPATAASVLNVTFTYTLADSLGATAVGNVGVTVNPSAPPPAPISVTTASVVARPGPRSAFTWTLSGTTSLTNTPLAIDVTTLNGTLRLGTVTPRRGSWSLTVRNSTQLPPTPTPTATITASPSGDTLTVPVERR